MRAPKGSRVGKGTRSLREWFAFRKRYQEEAGKNFDMLKFHDLVLDQGPLPVPAVEKLVMH